jgi:hypothetical protein
MVTSLPLLHAAQAAVGHGPPVLVWLVCFVTALCVGVFAGMLSTGYAPAPRTRRKVAMRAAAVLTGLALMPAVIPYDHLLSATHLDDVATHAEHCHDSPAACADAPVTSGPGQMIDSAPLLVEPVMLAVLLLGAAPLLIGLTRRPILRPPMRTTPVSI